MRDDFIDGDQFFLGIGGECRHGFYVALFLHLTDEGFEDRFDFGFVSLLDRFELSDELQDTLRKLLHLGIFVLADDLAVLNRVLVIAAQVVQKGDQASGLILSEDGVRHAQDRQNGQ